MGILHLGRSVIRAKRRGRLSRQEFRHRLGLESLENRQMLATTTVTTLEDVVDTTATTIAALNADPGVDKKISLREAVRAAEGTLGGDTIDFDTALDGGTITLSYADTDGSRDLDVLESLTVDAGLLLTGITIDASATPGNPSRIWEVNRGGTAPVSFRLVNVELTKGYTNENGGAVRASDVSLAIERSRISDNHAVGSGGGIYFNGVSAGFTLTVSDSTISNNTTVNDQGGGLAVEVGGGTTFALENSTIAGNRAGTGDLSVGEGGGLYYHNGQGGVTDITIRNTTVRDNIADKDGAGAFVSYLGPVLEEPPVPQLVITGSTFSGNHFVNNPEATGGGTGAGLAFCVKYKGKALIENSTFSNNSSLVSGATVSQGGGISVFTVSPDPFPNDTVIRTTLRNVTITENLADQGGGLFTQLAPPPEASIQYEVDTTLHNTIIDGNWADSSRTLAANIDGEDVNTMASSHNLVGLNSAGQSAGLMDGDKGNIVDTSNVPKLAPLADNGGPALTHKPLGPQSVDGQIQTASSAIDGGGNAEAAGEWDQRGDPFDRIVNNVVDIGAVEFEIIGGCDMDWDGDVDFDDIEAFVLGLSDPALYEMMYEISPVFQGDTDGDGNFDFDDIMGFVECLSASLFGNLSERQREIIEAILEILIIRLVELYQGATSSQDTELVELLFRDHSMADTDGGVPLKDLLSPPERLSQLALRA